MIKFHQPYKPEKSLKYIEKNLRALELSGDNFFTNKCESFISDYINGKKVLMTTSCTHALELAIRLLDIKNGDEVIIPSFTYPSTANAVLLAGAKVVYARVNLDTMLIDPDLLEEQITNKTKAIIVVHYGGRCCDMNPILSIASKYNIDIIEDAAQAFGSTYNGKFAGTLGTLGCFSFHQTKNITSGEGGALIINDENLIKRAEIIRQKGTNQEAFKSGLVPRYEWVDIGSSYSPSDLLMALLYGQLQQLEKIQNLQMSLFKTYVDFFKKHNFDSLESFSNFSSYGQVNGHIFYLLFKDAATATAYKSYMRENNIQVVTHFVPLHISKKGSSYLRPQDDFTPEDDLSIRLIRLPIYAGLMPSDQKIVLEKTLTFMR
ncbi:dTDP-4-amino-4,6-dideoxygalactose transaminase [Oceanirhabdus sp. W0125-5]|uniref:dTDP-4-amino-4,6-dideoxygalactose transaminase n=1 Tax=Oceanirhabdus sp. W0125-5 TaxID=2999116 RepID=UPI0022F2CF7C|nr:dTDP-4-amino-4,6-dideoxygalactose transaminase [Oceanirhabdus sp. W0125-5]WBW98866.1 dTDP-4-amino-4,6-dideoxygalactose transaminase [Oceanirhabdus sp. W0125-5]